MKSQTAMSQLVKLIIIGSEDDSHDFFSPEMDNLFNKSFYLDREEAVTLKKNYILCMSAMDRCDDIRLSLGLSSYETCVYSVRDSLRVISTLPAEKSPITDVRFSPDNPELLYVGSTKAIKLWDLRNPEKPVLQFKDTSDPKANNLHDKNFCSFDVNCAGRFVCAGTEVTDGDAFMLFWDTRQASILGGYWESHVDDITQIEFHPSEADRVVSGSTDGLINLYDISRTEEDEALLQSLNTESSVDKLKWHVADSDVISCATHTSDLQLWNVDDCAPYATFSRKQIASSLEMANEQVAESLYIADVHSTSHTGQLMLLAGSNLGNGRCLRSAMCSSAKLHPHTNFEGNKQIVRCSWFDSKREILITGGEAGILSIWKPGTGEITGSSQNQLKATSKLKEKPHKAKTKPY